MGLKPTLWTSRAGSKTTQNRPAQLPTNVQLNELGSEVKSAVELIDRQLLEILLARTLIFKSVGQVQNVGFYVRKTF